MSTGRDRRGDLPEPRLHFDRGVPPHPLPRHVAPSLTSQGGDQGRSAEELHIIRTTKRITIMPSPRDIIPGAKRLSLDDAGSFFEPFSAAGEDVAEDVDELAGAHS